MYWELCLFLFSGGPVFGSGAKPILHRVTTDSLVENLTGDKGATYLFCYFIQYSMLLLWLPYRIISKIPL